MALMDDNGPQPRLLSLATAVPPYALGQEDVARRARHLFAQNAAVDLDRLMPVFANAGIERRYSCVPIEWYEEPHGWADRNTLYLQNAVRLLERAGREAIARAGLGPEEIDGIVVASTTGVATPSLDAPLMGLLGLRRDVRRLPMFGLGCAGGVIGLARAADLARAVPGSRVLLLVVELCALSFRKNDVSKSNVVATALFGDGAAAAVVSCRGEGSALAAAGEYTWPDTLDIMGWDVTEEGLKAVFSRDIPALVRRHMRDVASEFLARHGFSLGEIDRFICHPGGVKVITALEEAFRLAPGALAEERGVLRDYGNMSAATLLFVLERTMHAGLGGTSLITALGPGFTAGFLLLDAA
jgi:alkylresorcinol/alkylpyrone synthase